MRVGILQTDHVLDEFQDEFGDYAGMFIELLSGVCEELEFTCYDVQKSVPATPDCDAYIITGSRHSVYDDLPWIAELVRFIRAALGVQRKILGVCFGHQLMAHFFGGEVQPAEGGWVVGVQNVEVLRGAHWMEPGTANVNLISSHKDQVARLPDGAELYATNAFCPIAGFTLGEHVWTVQGHPEFVPGYSKALMNYRREVLGEAVYQTGVASLQRATDAQRVARWMVNFMRAGA